MQKLFLVFLISLSLLLSASEPPINNKTAAPDKNYAKTLALDDFNDGNLSANPEWWVFDGIKPSFADHSGNKYLKLTGKADNYYVGGMGFYFGRSAAAYDVLVVDVLGHGQDSGVLRIQLFDDDNNTYELEQDANFQPLYDDQWEYELAVDWNGWRTIEIPFSTFVLANPGIGDGVWNPADSNGSGGLLHVQLITLLHTPTGSINIGLDNLRLAKRN